MAGVIKARYWVDLTFTIRCTSERIRWLSSDYRIHDDYIPGVTFAPITDYQIKCKEIPDLDQDSLGTFPVELPTGELGYCKFWNIVKIPLPIIPDPHFKHAATETLYLPSSGITQNIGVDAMIYCDDEETIERLTALRRLSDIICNTEVYRRCGDIKPTYKIPSYEEIFNELYGGAKDEV